MAVAVAVPVPVPVAVAVAVVLLCFLHLIDQFDYHLSLGQQWL